MEVETPKPTEYYFVLMSSGQQYIVKVEDWINHKMDEFLKTLVDPGAKSIDRSRCHSIVTNFVGLKGTPMVPPLGFVDNDMTKIVRVLYLYLNIGDC